MMQSNLFVVPRIQTSPVAVNVPTVAYTLAEAAIILKMSTRSVRRQIDRGHLRRCKVFGRILIPRKDVEGFIEKFAGY